MEAHEIPRKAALRELHEELRMTPLRVTSPHGTDMHMEPFTMDDCLSSSYGLYLDVPYRDHGIFRVYPFCCCLPVSDVQDVEIQLLGTEHDAWQWISIDQLEALTPAVTALAPAFHAATRGRFYNRLPPAIFEWASDTTSGAATMARTAVELVKTYPDESERILTLRPSMVAIVNAVREATTQSPTHTLEALERESHRLVEYTVQELRVYIHTMSLQRPFHIATFSRSSSIVRIVQGLRTAWTCDESLLDIVCSQSVPGEEGELMAQDLQTPWIPDDDVLERIRRDEIDLILVGADCVHYNGSNNDDSAATTNNSNSFIINKVGTLALALAAQASRHCQLWACADRYKLWEDAFPPPLEEDLFQVIPMSLLHRVLVPPLSEST
jgi:translation initiation factor 2B subunit (eIF-2B alpha/beta/delta family)/8-oxo-dGTP pyrophosphatase MutT (NUDIX family)